MREALLLTAGRPGLHQWVTAVFGVFNAGDATDTCTTKTHDCRFPGPSVSRQSPRRCTLCWPQLARRWLLALRPTGAGPRRRGRGAALW